MFAKKPLIICDADEVLVYFVVPLELFLKDEGYELHLGSYNLFGNIRHISNGEAAPKHVCLKLINTFFEQRVEQCPAVEDAALCLSRLANDANIIVLSNLPDHARQRREMSLANLGMPYQVISNTGAKGPAIKTLLAHHNHHAFFIDDISSHHSSVADHAPHVQRIHFVADPRIGALIPPADDAHIRLESWPDIEKYIRQCLGKNDQVGH